MPTLSSTLFVPTFVGTAPLSFRRVNLQKEAIIKFNLPEQIKGNKEILVLKAKLLASLGRMKFDIDTHNRIDLAGKQNSHWYCLEESVRSAEDYPLKMIEHLNRFIPQFEQTIMAREGQQNCGDFGIGRGQTIDELKASLIEIKKQYLEHVEQAATYSRALELAIRSSGLLTKNNQRVEPKDYKFGNKISIPTAKPDYTMFMKYPNINPQDAAIYLKKEKKLESLGAIQKVKDIDHYRQESEKQWKRMSPYQRDAFTAAKREESAQKMYWQCVTLEIRSGKEQLEKQVIHLSKVTEEARIAGTSRQELEEDIRENGNSPTGALKGHQLVELINAYEASKLLLDESTKKLEEYTAFEKSLEPQPNNVARPTIG